MLYTASRLRQISTGANRSEHQQNLERVMDRVNLYLVDAAEANKTSTKFEISVGTEHSEKLRRDLLANFVKASINVGVRVAYEAPNRERLHFDLSW